MPEENRAHQESLYRLLLESPGISSDFPGVAGSGAHQHHSSCGWPSGYSNEWNRTNQWTSLRLKLMW